MTPRAIILAAGRGSRMGSLTDHEPKCFSKLHGHRLIDWQLKALRSAGIADIALVRGYAADAFDYPLQYFDNPHWQETNMVASLSCARAWLSTYDCIISYSDIVYSGKCVETLLALSADISVTYDPNWRQLWELRFDDPLSDAESFRLNNKSELLEIGNRVKQIEDIQGQYMGLLKISPTGWQTIEAYLLALPPAQLARLDMTTLLQELLKRGKTIQAVPNTDPWYEVDSAQDLRLYQDMPLPC